MSYKTEKLVGQRIGAVLHCVENGEIAFVSGVLVQRDRGYLIRDEDFELPMPEDFGERLRRIEPSPDAFDGVEFVVGLTVGPMPEGHDPGEFKSSGLKWPGTF